MIKTSTVLSSESARTQALTAANALIIAFIWADTSEGWSYWAKVYNRLVRLSGNSDMVIKPLRFAK